MLRGTGIDGLAGMREVRKSDDGFTVIKPLLGVRKKDIVAYCEEKSLNPCIDYTNDEPVYDRNRIRLELIPYLERYNPNVSEAKMLFVQLVLTRMHKQKNPRRRKNICNLL